MHEGRVRIRMTMIRNKRHDPDYTAQNARDFNALRGIELVDARVNRDGELIAIFDVSVPDPETTEKRLQSFANALLPADEDPESVKFEELAGDVVALPSSKVVPLPGLDE